MTCEDFARPWTAHCTAPRPGGTAAYPRALALCGISGGWITDCGCCGIPTLVTPFCCLAGENRPNMCGCMYAWFPRAALRLV
ncbi:hypothetical protein PsYK624_073040 [Phanerochaete sordida]|uniref:Uncharacterized protein n=1 Tax=Phanerochaete sordida TaxID=48140 RepID=A0A9P3GC40_9APHY|nr:hypothetical protein PsYK624_073040 [Phanerochaete sordida]